jgi:putative copper resistance protein D
MGSMESVAHDAPLRQMKTAEEIEADKRFSEFNHRFAGIFVLLVGLLSVAEPKLAERFRWMRYFWSALFFIPGVYLLIWSDPESWPIGNQTLSYVIHSNMQVLQHKVFSVLLLALSAVEFVRIRKQLHSAWVSSIFPILAGAGALLLLYHDPNAHAAMGPDAHEAMEVVQHQHLGFAITGFGIALSKGIADVGKFHPRLFRNLFAVMMVVLAGLLMTYSE